MEQEQTAKKNSKGCLFYFLITSLVAVILVLVGAFIAFYYFSNYAYNLIEPNLEEKPIKYDVQVLANEEYQDFMAEFNKKVRSVRVGHEETFILSSEEINSLIISHPDFESVKNNVFFTLKGDVIHLDIACKLSIPFNSDKKQALNFSTDLKLTKTSDNKTTFQILELTPHSGKEFKAEIADYLHNYFEKSFNLERFASSLATFKIAVHDSKLEITVKGKDMIQNSDNLNKEKKLGKFIS